ncbi:MAG: Na-K-Cl cotransporter, partial [Myxococcota bacterium]|nr:Na-K-Cl cotransporter [Myxococcota bacterium]
AICLAAVLAGGLNAVASLLTMFFLGTYATLNFVAGVETALAQPSFRPRFRVPAAVPLLGGVGCVGAMLAIDPLATAVAVLAVLALLVALTWRGLRVHFGDVRQGLWTVIARTGLLRLQGARVPESWRPHLLVLTGDPTRRWYLLEMARALDQGRGFLSVGAVLPHPDPHPTWPAEMERTIRERLARERLACMVRVVHAPDLYAGAGKLVDAYGLGAVVPDTILLGPNEDPEELDAYCAMVAGCRRAGRHTLIARPDQHGGVGARRRVDVWWGGLERNGALMLLLGDLLQRSEGWRDATLTLRTIVDEAAAVAPVSRNLERFVHESRLRSEVDVVARAGRTPDAIMAEVSKGADLVLLGVGEPDDDFCAYFADLQERVAALPATLQVMAAEEAAGLQEAVVDPEAAHEDRARDRADA